MFLEKIDIIITILGSLAVAIFSLISGADLSELALRLVLTIILFYILGFIIKLYLQKSVFKVEEDTEIEADRQELQSDEVNNDTAEQDVDESLKKEMEEQPLVH